MRVCSKCHIEKNESEFGSRGLVCKKCINEHSREWRENNKDKIREYRNRNRGKIINYNKKYKEVNREKIPEWSREYYSKNKGKIIKKQKDYYERKKEYISIRSSNYRRSVMDKLDDIYLKTRLRQDGYTKEEIKNVPILLDKKKLDILIYRSHKFKKQNHVKKSIKRNS